MLVGLNRFVEVFLESCELVEGLLLFIVRYHNHVLFLLRRSLLIPPPSFLAPASASTSRSSPFLLCSGLLLEGFVETPFEEEIGVGRGFELGLGRG
jgi:hypothetical protein